MVDSGTAMRTMRGVASTALARLTDTAREHSGLTVGDALTSTGASFGFIVLILALPALIPIPGPFGMVFGSDESCGGDRHDFQARHEDSALPPRP